MGPGGSLNSQDLLFIQIALNYWLLLQKSMQCMHEEMVAI